MKIKFIKNNKKYFNFVIIPIFAIFVINLIFFILSSFFDLEIMQFFEKGMKYKFIRYLSIFYVNSGNTELFLTIMICCYIIIQYIFNYFNKKNGFNTEFWMWFVFSFAIVFQIVMGIVTYFTKISSRKIIEGVNSLGEVVQLHNFNTIFTVNEYLGLWIFIIIFQTVLLIAILLYIKFVFVKKQGFYESKHWVKSIKILATCGLLYVVVVIMKLSFGRGYYNSMYETIERRIEYSGLSIDWNFNWDNAPTYRPWWEFDGLIGNPGKVKWNLNDIFDQFSFPSGHMAATTTVCLTMAFIVNPENKNLNYKKITGLYLLIAHFFLMQITFLINGSHWLSDTSFTVMLSIGFIFLTNYLVDIILKKIAKKYEKSTQN